MRDGIFGWSYPPGCSGVPADDWPELCPVCEKENMNDDGNWLCEEAPGYCSVECRDREAAAEAAFDAQMDKDMELMRQQESEEWESECE